MKRKHALGAATVVDAAPQRSGPAVGAAAGAAKPKGKQGPKPVKVQDVFADAAASDGGFPTVNAELYMDDDDDTGDLDAQLRRQVTDKAAQKKKRSGGFQSMGAWRDSLAAASRLDSAESDANALIRVS